MAPNRPNPTQDNGSTLPRTDLHIALILPDRATAQQLKNKIRVVKPPLWPGKVYLHFIPEDQRYRYRSLDTRTLIALVDTGLVDAKDVDIGPPAHITLGYPSGDTL